MSKRWIAPLLLCAGLLGVGCSNEAATNRNPPGSRAQGIDNSGTGAGTTGGGTATGNTAGATAADPYGSKGATGGGGGTSGASPVPERR